MLLGQHNSRCTGMIARIGFRLLVTGVMLLIDDNQADVRDGQEDGTSWSEDHEGLVIGDW